MRLFALNILNFKGITDLTITAEGKDINIYGDNGTGKTTIADAYTWLLTGKDSKGSTKFDIYPKDAADGVNASVTGRFTNSTGDSFTLQRTHKEVFSRKNGEAEKQKKGNTTDYYINGVPKPLKDYSAFVDEQFGSEQKLIVLTDPDYFPGKLDYKERRDILIKTFAPHYDDKDVINNHEELAPLGNYIGAMTNVSELAEQLKAERKKINKRLDELPARIDELQKSYQELPEDDTNYASLAAKRQQQNNTLIALQSGEDISNLRRIINDKLAERAKAEAEYIQDNFKGNTNVEQRLSAARAELSKLEYTINDLNRDISGRNNLITGLQEELKALREQHKAKHSERFDSTDTLCPTCGQVLPEDNINSLRETFNLKKASALEKIAEDGKNKAKIIEDFTVAVNENNTKLSAALGSRDKIRAVINELSQTVISPPDFSQTEEAHKYDSIISELKAQLESLQANSTAAIDKARQALAITDSKLQGAKNRDGIIQANKNLDSRIKELTDEETRLGKELAKKENLLNLTETFTKLQAADIENKVNSAFKFVQWKLFDLQINGGTKPCCEAIVDGVAYTSNLNTAAKLNAGLDIINTLSKANSYDTLPIFIDNAESITRYTDVDAQVIRLYVSQQDKRLRVEAQI